MTTMFGELFKRIFHRTAANEPAVTVSQARIEAALRTRPKPEDAPRPRGLRVTDDSQVVMGNCFVIDGKRVKIGETVVRLMGIDAPDPHEPFGHEAKWKLHEICKDQIVTGQIVGKDAAKTPVAVCYLQDGRDLAAELVKQGLALDWPYYSNGKYAEFEPKDVRKTLTDLDERQQEFAEKSKRGRKRNMPVWS